MFKSQLRGIRLQKREELKFAVRSAVVIFGVDFYKDVLMCGETYAVRCVWLL